MTDHRHISEPQQRLSLAEKLRRLLGGAPTQVDGHPAPPPTQGDLRLRIHEFETSTVRDVMTSRVDIAAVDVNASMEETLRMFGKESHSRMPVYRGSLDEPLGFVHLKDVVAELAKSDWSPEILASRPLARLQREIMYVPESMPLPDLLVQMQATRMHIALVIDEFGGTAGLVSLEDLVEQIVGDIEDEHDEAPPAAVRRSKTTWDVDGAAHIEDLERDTGLSLTVREFEDEIETISGLCSALAGKVPAVGDVIEHPSGLRLEVLDADPRRVKRLRIRSAKPAPVLAPVEAPAIDRPGR